MVADRTTDAISHFIGLFGQKVEDLRHREFYDTFTPLREDVDLGPLEIVEIETDAKFSLRQSDAKPLPTPNPEAVPVAFPIPSVRIPLPPAPADVSRTGDTKGDWQVPPPGHGFHLQTGEAPDLPQTPEPMAPGSTITITKQSLRLGDNDRLGQGGFRDPISHAHDLENLTDLARSLHAPEGFGAGQLPDAAAVASLKAALDAFTASKAAGIEAFLQRGETAPASLLNGRVQDELPDWDDVVPKHHLPEVEEDEATLLSVRDLPRDYAPNPDTPDGHSLVTGGNLLANEAYLSISQVDAPLIAVGGSWKSHDIVSQVAALRNHDSGSAAAMTPGTVYQTIEIESTPSPAAWQADRDLDGGAPKGLLFDVVEGDLFIANYVEQIIQLMDNDMFGMAISSANSAFILGDNTLVNATTLLTGGFAYDLILVAGDFLQINSIQQTMVLLDDDRIETEAVSVETPMEVLPHRGLASDGIAETGKDVLIDGAATEAAAPEDLLPREEPAPSSGRADDEATVGQGLAGGGSAEGTEGYETASDNLLLNQAKLTSFGVDIRAELSETLAELLHDPELSLQALQDRLMNDPTLSGLEQARVLKIEGDLIQSNTVKQIIMAADNDDIRIDGALPGEMNLVAGENALLNAATIASRGVDSTVMADSGYSELLIHQAGLVDEPDLPEMPASDLASEAVAFLMEDTMDGISEQMADKFHASDAPHVAEAYDLMASSVV